MSSRSFRRRSNRRRHRPQDGPEAQGQRPPAPQGDRAPRADQPQGAPAPRGGGGPRRDQRQGRGGRQGQGKAPEQRSRPEVPMVFPDCPVCGKPVRELASALTHRVSRVPAHFDCVVRELRDTNEMTPQEKLCYLGGGTFGILEFRPPGGPSRFVIKRRIQYEEKEAPQDWKKPLQVSC
jgi:hypothetical protein